ncbi:MAG TPA: ribonuclease R [Alphaproteobacteria bacterium]|nr:ribonuclease R [Alphaproteobacteria bacterium]
MPRRHTAPSFPDSQEILRFIADNPDRSSKRDIARAFAIKGPDRRRLQDLLTEMAEAGQLERAPRHGLRAGGELPPVAVIEVVGVNDEGDLLARTSGGQGDTEASIVVPLEGHRRGAAGPGDRLLARLTPTGSEGYEARVIKRLGRGPEEVLGIFDLVGGQGRIQPVDRRMKRDFAVSGPESLGAAPGDLVLADVQPGRRYGLPKARVRRRLGSIDAPGAFSAIAIHSHGIPTKFSAAALAEAEAAATPELGRREDLRHLPLVTIDPVEARDFDDAVWAAADDDDANPGGFRLLVAIADVAAYVRPGSALDTEACERGNSVYFPDRVVAMLPEALSNELCSLKPGIDRACLAVWLTIDADGRLLDWRFCRALMRSAARLSYQQVQEAQDGNPDATTAALLEPVIEPLYAAFRALTRERARRQPLELVVPEMRVKLDDEGRILSVAPRLPLDSHRLIEEFMVTANVAAARALSERGAPCMYRVHAPPKEEALEGLRPVLASVGLKLAKGQVPKPRNFNTLIEKAAATPHARLVNELILRAQSQACYDPGNYGHFGLALGHYAHFTSPIRRYADLLVHRALIASLELGEDGLSEDAAAEFGELGRLISGTERRAMKAERETVDRFLAAHLEDRRGAVFAARISGVIGAGLFVALDENGADGFVPGRSLIGDRYRFDEAAMALVGESQGRRYRLGDAVEVRLVEAVAASATLRFELCEEDSGLLEGRYGIARTPRPKRRRRKR